MDILAKIFGSSVRLKLMRLFLLNPENNFSLKDLRIRTRLNVLAIKKEIRLLLSLGFLRQKLVKKTTLFFLNQNFAYNQNLRLLLNQDNKPKKEDILKIFKSAGKIKLLLISGLFIGQSDVRVDLLIVGDNLNRRMIEERVRALEAEMGQELSYAVFETNEFLYRLSMHDRLIREIFDSPHEKAIDALEIS